MSSIGDFFGNLFGMFVDFLKNLATNFLTRVADVLVDELQEGLPMALKWAKDAVEAAEAAGGDGSSKWNAAYAAFTSKATSEGYEWSKTAIDTVLQNAVLVVTRDTQAFLDKLNNPTPPSVE